MEGIIRKLSIVIGSIILVGSYYPFLSGGSPLILILSIFGAFLILNGIFGNVNYSKKFYYLAMACVTVYWILITFYICLFGHDFLKSPEFYVYNLFMVVWIVSFVLRYSGIKKYQKIVEQYDDALKLNSKDAISWNNKGTALVELGRYKEAIECFNKSLELDPKNAAAWHNKAVSLTKRKKHLEAVKYYDKSVELDETFVIAKKAGNIILKYGL
jgi:Flp pilus assembly protein TadD, contains TPR repeats